MTEPLLELRGVRTVFRTGSGDVPAVDDVTLELGHGRVMAIIGESGSGKSALLRTILGIQPPTARESGEILLDGRDLLTLSKKARADTRGRLVSMVFQDPMTALDPVFTVEEQLVETLRRHLPLGRAEARRRALELLELVQIPAAASRLKAYPFEMSGGMRQRVVIAMALACEPALLLADEPTTALDVTVQAKILDLVREIQRERRMGVLIVTHDLAVAAAIADDVGVMYAGRLVEYGPVEKVILEPGHPYTRGLLAANVLPGQQTRPRSIPGAPPSLQRLPPGCAFAPRCDVATVECWERQPPQVTTGPGTWSRCLHAQELVGVPVPQAGLRPDHPTPTTPRENSRVRT
ncbi:hypothetical protein BJF78_01990 [Pseudonocardia sp. CNS-139]|nr:hypothetical protein BJF78_01990 [Pseudonocardia sp. CNS-139]